MKGEPMDRNEFIDLLTEELSEDPDNNRLNRILEAADEYAENEKAQLYCEGTTEGTTSDTISRQAAIDALRTCYDTETISMDNGDEYINYGDAVGGIEQLPSVQPEYRIDEWCHDCKEYDQEHHCCPRFNRVIREALKEVQLEPKEGHWIPHEGIDGDIQYECSECGVLWEFNDGTPEDNEAHFCPKCGAKMITK